MRRDKELHERVKRLRSALGEAIKQFERNDFAAANRSGQNVLEEADVFFESLTESYRQALFDRKLKSLPELKTRHKKFSAMKDSPDLDEYIRFLSDIERVVALAEVETRHLYPMPWPGWAWLRENRRLVLIGLIASAIVVGSITTARWFVRKDYGLTATYFADTKMETPYRTRRDRQINFDWGTSSPFSGWKQDDFSVRWEGFLIIENEAEYDFVTYSDDGVRLRIDGTILIENWSVHPVAVNRATMPLAPGKHQIQIDYFEKKKSAVMKLYWTDNDRKKPAPVPFRHFKPAAD